MATPNLFTHNSLLPSNDENKRLKLKQLPHRKYSKYGHGGIIAV